MSYSYPIYVVIEPIIFPNIIPTNGINITFFIFKFFKKVININVPDKANTKDTIAFCIVVASGIRTIAITIPNLAESIVAPVVGETNLF